ncbi:MAG TPA: hypothetical protein VGN72_02820, partial [Tepidisphaeraceae bacterium]|nr:hypothetical protein [Tepidisphaeraceae bacterium]
MLILPQVIPGPQRKWRKRPIETKRTPTPPPPAPLTLVSAVYDGEVDLVLTLTFSRAIDVDAIDGAAIIVNDPGAMLDQL